MRIASAAAFALAATLASFPFLASAQELDNAPEMAAPADSAPTQEMAAPATVPATAMPPAADFEARVPLVIIRFNQRNTMFDKALYNAVSSAVAAKPDVAFDVLLKPSPQGGGDANLDRVTSALAKLGVPASQIHSSHGAPSGQRYDEVDVFVR